MCRGDDQSSAILPGKLFGITLQILGLGQDALDQPHRALAGLGQADQAFAATDEDLDAKLDFKLANLLADPRLRGVQAIGDLGQVEVVADGRPDIFQLLKIHLRHLDKDRVP